MRNLLEDLRYGLRTLLKSPGFAATAIISLAVGIGANAAIFSVVDKLLLRSLPIRSPEQIVSLSAESMNPHFVNTIFSHPDFIDYRDHNEVLSGLIAFIQIDGRLGAGDETERVNIDLVSGNYFDVLGVGAALGRTFLPEEGETLGTHPVAVLSEGLWQRRFGADRDIIGKTVILNDASYTVIGVAPKGFRGTRLERPTDIWAPLMMRPQLMPGTMSLKERKLAWLRLMGRLKPGVDIERAQTSLNLLARDIREANTPTSDRGLPFYERQMLLAPGGRGISFLRTGLGKTLRLLMAVVGLLLLIACANVATLLLARSTARRKEIAVRLALGASRARLVRQLLTESLLLALVGAAAGLLLAPWLKDLLLAFQPDVNIGETVLADNLDARVLGFTLLVSVLCAAIFGLVPALQSSRLDLAPALKDSDVFLSQRERRLNARNVLVVAQVALALVVLIGGGLLIKSLRNLFAIDPGFKTDKVLIVPIELPREKYRSANSNEFFRQLTERLKSMPGAEAVSTASITPLSGSVGTRSVIIEGYQAQSNENIGIDYNEVGPGYHELMGIPLINGRGFTEQDREGAPGVVVINEAMARLYFRNQTALGKRLSFGPGNPWLEIIGVTRDIKIHSLTETPMPHFDLPSLQDGYGAFGRVLIRTAGGAMELAPAVRQAVKAIEPRASITNATTLSKELSNSIAPARMATALTGLFGLTALLLASVGLYGVMNYSVSRRTRELGVRMALGAQMGDVLRLVVKQGMTLTVIGVAIGLVGAYALTSVVTGLLYGVSPTDPLTFAVISVLLTGVALGACLVPARRAAKVDPMVALRDE